MAYRPKTRTVPHGEYQAIFDRISEGTRIVGSSLSDDSVFMLDDEFQPTQNMATVRWIMVDIWYDVSIFKVDNAGDAILLIRGD